MRPSSYAGCATAWGECPVEQCHGAGTSAHWPSQPERTGERPSPASHPCVHKTGVCGEWELVQGFKQNSRQSALSSLRPCMSYLAIYHLGCGKDPSDNVSQLRRLLSSLCSKDGDFLLSEKANLSALEA